MIFRKTYSNRQKGVWKTGYSIGGRRNILIETITYWFLFIPIYTKDCVGDLK